MTTLLSPNQSQSQEPPAQAQRPVRERGTVSAEDRELALSHPLLLLMKYGFINDPNRPQLGIFKWLLWRWQIDLLLRVCSRTPDGEFEHKRVVILKSRQLGVSWLMAGIAIWLFLAFPGSKILMVSKGQKEAKDLMDKAVFLYSNLPPEFHFARQMGDQASHIVFRSEELNSEIVSLPDAPGAGRSYTSTVVIVDEWAFQDYAADIYGGLEPTLGQYGQLIGVSTANGPSGTFYSIYDGAVKEENGFLPIFLRYDLRPGRTEEWRELEDRKFRAAGTPERTASEYPRSWQEAFRASITGFFPLDLLETMEAMVREPIQIRPEIAGAGAIHIFKPALPYLRYGIGADVAKGVSSGNFSAAVVQEATTGEVVASMRVHLPPEIFAARLDALGREYNEALLAVEANFLGVPNYVLQKHLHYPNLFHRMNGKGDGFSDDPGWYTTRTTKPDMLLGLRGALLSYDFVSPCRWIVDECKYFAETKTDKGLVDYAAASGHTDDMIVSAAISQAVRRYVRGGWRGVRKTGRLSR